MGTFDEKAHQELLGQIAAVVGRLNTAYGELVSLIAQANAHEQWAGPGIRSLEHWLTWQTGVSRSTAAQLTRVVNALETHPATTKLLIDGQLTLDQTAVAVTALPDHDAEIAELAPLAMVDQIRTIARASKHAAAPKHTDPTSKAEQFHFDTGDDGWLNGKFRLAPDRAETVRNALHEARDRLFTDGNRDIAWADALVDVCDRSLGTLSPERAAKYLTYLYIDPSKPVDARWLSGITVNAGIRELFTCDGLIRPVIVEDSIPVGVGRAQRTIPERTRRIVHHRDYGVCQSPWCNRTRGLDVHHILHWEHGGETETPNLILLCRRCHRGLHRGDFQITGNADHPETLRFLNDRGVPVIRPQPVADPVPNWKQTTPTYRRPLGERLDTHWLGFAPPPRAG